MKIINNYSKTMLLFVVLWTSFSCSNDKNLGDLNDTVFVRHKDADMPAYIHGNALDKTFLIILHGGPGGYGLAYRSNTIKSKIEKECAVVYFDQRGSGMAQGSYSENGINIDIMAEDVLALVKVLKHKYGDDSKFFLMGHSWGGTLGTATLLMNQNDFLGWIEVDGSNNPKGSYLEYISNFKRVASEQITIGNNIDYWESVIDIVNNVDTEYNIEDMRKLNSEAFEAEEKLKKSNVISRDAKGDDSNIFKYNLLTLFWNTNNTQSILDKDLFENVDYTNKLSEITIPSLVLSGRHDMVVPIKFAQVTFDNLGSSEKELVFFEKSGHSPMATEPNLFAKEVIQFINQNN